MKEKYYLLSNDDDAQICASLRFSIKTHQDVKDILARIREYRIWSDKEVETYNKCTEEIERLTKVYNRFYQ